MLGLSHLLGLRAGDLHNKSIVSRSFRQDRMGPWGGQSYFTFFVKDV